MSVNLTVLKEDNFKKNLAKGNWVVDFWAEWCGPCRILGPIVEETAKEMKDKVHFGKVNVDEESNLAQEFDVMSIPTLIFFQDGQIVNRIVGVHDKEDIIRIAKGSF